MAGNEWIYGYLDAIINVGGEGGLSGKVSGGDHPHSHPHRNIPVVAQGRLNFNPSTYFVEEVITSYDEADLHRTWMKAIAMRNSQERNVRMENLCWRIWHLARRKKQAALEDSQRISHRNYEREQGLKTAAEDFSAEDLSEGDYKEKLELESASLIAAATAASGDSSKMFQNNSFVDVSADDNPSQTKRLYIVLISVHGLVRGDNMELGRDSDTGGQVKYVVELARALATMPQVYRVDLLTRQILSPEVDWSYGEPTEMLTLPSSLLSSRGGGGGGGGGSSGGCAYIVRIPCGPREKYIRKELLWPYLQEFVDGALAHILNMARVLGEQIKLDKEQYVWPHVIHGHYADAGGIAALLSGSLNVPMVLTGHSLGRNKLEQLLKQGWQSKEEINATYKIIPRIEAEELSLDAAELVITSTQQEIEEQWGLYDGFDVRLERVLRARMKRGVSCHGRYMPRMVVIPPGMDFSNVLPPDFGESGEGDTEVDPLSPRQEPLIWSEIKRFLNNPHKPMILALARPDPKKNITTLLKAFGECRPLRDLANLTLIIGNRDDIDDMPGGNALVLITVLKLIDKYDLYGQVAFPKHHKQQDVPDIYRLAARTKGVFINPALVEPFGLTLIEAAAHGLPIVATKNGGPVDIQRSLRNGLLVDPYDSNSIADALLKLVSDRSLWTECRRNGLKNISLYSWPQHCRVYLAHIAQCRMRHPLWKDVGETGEGGAGGVGPSVAGDSLKDEHDLSLRLSIDEKVLIGSGSSSALDILTESSAESQRGTARYCGFNTPISSLKKALEITKFRKESLASADEQSMLSSVDKSTDKISSFGNGNSLYKSPSSLRRRRRILVVSVDAYDPLGKAGERMLHVISEIFNAMKHYKTYNSMHFGFILSTAMTLSETIGLLCMGDIPLHEFSALICSSGSELYYPTPIQSEDTSAASSSLESQFYFDPDYATHIDYRWAGDGIKRSSQKLLASTEGDKGQRSGGGDIAFLADEESSSMHCLAYEVKDPSRAPKVDELRKRFRMCGLRSHILYCKNQTRLHILPLFASRSQALRYLFVRWGADISNMIVFVGEMGDSDYEEQLPGMHKTVILRGAIELGCDQSLSGTTIITSSSDTSYHKDDATQPSKSGNIVTSESCTVEAITNVLKELFG